MVCTAPVSVRPWADQGEYVALGAASLSVVPAGLHVIVVTPPGVPPLYVTLSKSVASLEGRPPTRVVTDVLGAPESTRATVGVQATVSPVVAAEA